MSVSRFEFDKLVNLLGRSEHDPEVRNFLGESTPNIEREEYYGSLEFKPEGVDVVFKEAPWVLSSKKIIDPKELYLCAFHLHGDGHEGTRDTGVSCPMELLWVIVRLSSSVKWDHPPQLVAGSLAG